LSCRLFRTADRAGYAPRCRKIMRHYGYLPGGRPASRPPAKKTGQVRLILPPLGGQGLAGDHVVSSRSPASSRERRCRWRPSTRCGRRSGHCPAPGREAPVGRALRPSGRGSPLARRPDHKRGAQAQRGDRNTRGDASAEDADTLRRRTRRTWRRLFPWRSNGPLLSAAAEIDASFRSWSEPAAPAHKPTRAGQRGRI